MCGVGEYGVEALEPVAAMRRHYPREWLPERDDDRDWTPDRIPMCQAWGWQHQWYERPETFAGWVASSQQHQAWSVRFMHEALRRRADIIPSTSIHLLVNAWPNNWLKALCSFDREPMPGFFAFADANTPVAVNVRTDRHAMFGGGEAVAEIWALNDTSDPVAGLHVVYRATLDGHTLLVNQSPFVVGPVSARALGLLRFDVPPVASPARLEIRASLTERHGRVLHDHTVAVDVFPACECNVLEGHQVGVHGDADGRAWRLALAFGGTPVLWHDGLPAEGGFAIADTPDLPEGLSAWIERGGCLLGLAQPPDTVWQIGLHRVKVRGLTGHQFASRKTGHPVVADLGPFHFSLWYDRSLDRITHLLDSGLEGEGLAPITLTGHGIWYTKKEDIPSGAELHLGHGRILLDQVRAPERMDGEPRAAIYLERLLDYALSARSL